jgi:hypothetical protein
MSGAADGRTARTTPIAYSTGLLIRYR